LARYYYTCIAQQLQFLVKSHAASISDELALATFTQNLGHAHSTKLKLHNLQSSIFNSHPSSATKLDVGVLSSTFAPFH
jgi:hypothetical protein